jgi:hypothetical protein
MENPVLKLPDKLDLNNSLQCARRLDSFRRAKVVTIDMGGERHFAPFPMLFLAAKVLEFRELHPDTTIDIKNYAAHAYAAHMGFFKAAGFDIGKEVGEARGSARYLPIRALSRSELRKDPSDNTRNSATSFRGMRTILLPWSRRTRGESPTSSTRSHIA